MEGPPALSSFRRHVSKGLLPLLPSGGAVGREETKKSGSQVLIVTLSQRRQDFEMHFSPPGMAPRYCPLGRALPQTNSVLKPCHLPHSEPPACCKVLSG